MIGTHYAGKRNKLKLLISENNMTEFLLQAVNSAKFFSMNINTSINGGVPRRRRLRMRGHVTGSFAGVAAKIPRGLYTQFTFSEYRFS